MGENEQLSSWIGEKMVEPTYKPILQHFTDDISTPLERWNQHTVQQMRFLDKNLNVNLFSETAKRLPPLVEGAAMGSVGGLLGAPIGLFANLFGLKKVRNRPDQVMYSGKELFASSAFPVELLRELEMLARFDSGLSIDDNRMPIYRNLVAYVEDIVRKFLLRDLSVGVRDIIFRYAPSDEALKKVSIPANRMSLGVMAQWCRMLEEAIISESREVSNCYLARVGRLDIFLDHSFSNMLNDFCPYRNDVVHTRQDLKRNPDEIVPIIFGRTYFHDWWKQSYACITPFTKALQGHAVLRQSIQQ